MSTVVVINKNKEPYTGRYDGENYTFPPGDAVTVPEETAAFLFGYGQDDARRQRIIIRNGWQKNGIPGDDDGPEAAKKRLANFVFKRGPEPEPAPMKEKQLLPQHRAMTGINAVSPEAKDDGKTILPRSAVRLPGGKALVPPAAPAA